MLIDWFTVVAQALNFLILVWLLKRFLYKPILDAIDAREKRIATELAEADAQKAEAQQERDEFQRKNEAFEQEQAALFSQVEEEATAERQRLLDEARKESDTVRTKWQEALRNEQQIVSEEFARRTRDEVFAISRKTLTDLATANLEEHMTETFIRRLRELKRVERDELQSAFHTASNPAMVRSAFPLPTAQRQTIEEAVKEVLGLKTSIQFETAPDLVSGIELTANGHKVAWSIDQYLTSMKKSLEDLLKEDHKGSKKPGSNPEQQEHEHRT